jgi:cytochrome c-type protein NapC
MGSAGSMQAIASLNCRFGFNGLLDAMQPVVRFFKSSFFFRVFSMSEKQPGALRQAWAALRRPAVKWSVLSLVVLGFAGGVVFVNAYSAGMASTNTLEFCVGCHSMHGNLDEYKKTIHWQNRSGVRAICADCHVPHNTFVATVYRKLEAANDVWAQIVGRVDTPEKFEARRMTMATREWARMKASDSATCRSCHDFDAMGLEQQGQTRYNKHMKAKADGQTCIDCHKGVAHKLPKEYRDPDEEDFE